MSTLKEVHKDALLFFLPEYAIVFLWFYYGFRKGSMQEIIEQLTGSNLKEKRENLLLTQEELAREVGVSKLAISQWENRKAKPSKRHLRALKSLFDARKEA